MPVPTDNGVVAEVVAIGHDRQTRSSGHRAGTDGIWVFVLVDLVFFALLFLAFGLERAKDPDLFDRTSDGLHPALGLINLFVLLTSSWSAALAVRAYRANQVALAASLFRAAAGCGAVFATIKLVEYRLEVFDGTTVAGNPFFTMYLVMTGLHFLHVLVGIALLLGMARSMTLRRRTRSELRRCESTAIYWHMVDLLWIVIFPTLYLAR